MDQKRTSNLQKDKKLEEYKNLVDHLQADVKKFQITIDQLFNRILECERIIKFEKEKNEAKSTQKASTYEWVVPLEILKQGQQSSNKFYTASTPFCFQLSAYLENNKLAINLHRCRGINDNEIGKVKSSLQGLKFVIYVISKDGKVKMNQKYFNHRDFDFDVAAKYEQSKGNGWQDFLNGERLLDWLIKGRLHIFCRIDLRLE